MGMFLRFHLHYVWEDSNVLNEKTATGISDNLYDACGSLGRAEQVVPTPC
jgi:hypothetical protein